MITYLKIINKITDKNLSTSSTEYFFVGKNDLESIQIDCDDKSNYQIILNYPKETRVLLLPKNKTIIDYKITK